MPRNMSIIHYFSNSRLYKKSTFAVTTMLLHFNFPFRHHPFYLTSPPFQLPARVLEVILSKFPLHNRPKIHIEDTRVSVRTRTLRPFEIRRATSHCNILPNLRASTCQPTSQDTLCTQSTLATKKKYPHLGQAKYVRYFQHSHSKTPA
jgi:hypothetical protein